MTCHTATSRAIAGVALLLLAGCGTRPPTVSSDAGPSTGAPGTAAALPPEGTMAADPDGVVPAVPTHADPEAVAAATRFVQAWARSGLPAGRWLAGVQPLAIPAYAEQLTTVDPANVPASRITGPGRVSSAVTNRTEVDVPTDAGVLRVTVVRSGGRWLVATIGRREEAGTP
ncbi:hypothetical protein ACFYMB_31500 [Micromonospora haikouensis]|uniref:hypothetical protein n=1 Tax=Micromonospora haikouensis TaxID=686309 RepID=UPI0036BDAA14